MSLSVNGPLTVGKRQFRLFIVRQLNRYTNISMAKELPTLLRDEASVYFNVTMVKSMISGVMSVLH